MKAGAAGAVGNVTGVDAADGGPLPTALVAVTEKVYVTPPVSPVTVALVAEPFGVVTVKPPGFDVTKQLVMAEPPLLAGAVQLTVA
jgi:hypothetical protein